MRRCVRCRLGRSSGPLCLGTIGCCGSPLLCCRLPISCGLLGCLGCGTHSLLNLGTLRIGTVCLRPARHRAPLKARPPCQHLRIGRPTMPRLHRLRACQLWRRGAAGTDKRWRCAMRSRLWLKVQPHWRLGARDGVGSRFFSPRRKTRTRKRRMKVRASLSKCRKRGRGRACRKERPRRNTRQERAC